MTIHRATGKRRGISGKKPDPEVLAILLADPKQVERFWSKVIVAGPDECWEWVGRRHKFGYGVFRLKDHPYRAHRIALMLKTQAIIPVGLLSLHSCDNRACCNPKHLRAGTGYDNMMDAITRKRFPWLKTQDVQPPPRPRRHRRDEKYKRLIIRFAPDDLKQVKAAAASRSMSTAEFVRWCVAEQIAKTSKQLSQEQ